MTVQFILIFTAIQLVNVVLSTVKSILMVKGTKLTAAISNALYYGYYTVVIIFTADSENIIMKIIVTTLTNLVGVYFGLSILERFKKDRLWEIVATVVDSNEIEELRNQLKCTNISFNSNTLDNDEGCVFRIYSKNKKQSNEIKNIFKKFNSLKYIVHEATQTFL